MSKIKITQILPTDLQGGASIAGYRLHCEFLKNPNFDSVVFVDKKYSKDNTVIQFSNPILRLIERGLNKLGYFTGLQYMFSVNWIPLIFNKRFRETDIFIIRNIHGGYLPLWFPNILNLFAPIIWRLPDMWPLTGHCVYCLNDEDWKKDIVKACPKNNYPAVWWESSKILLKLKKFFYKRVRLHIVAPSRWMEDNVKHSILSKFPINYIPTGVNVDEFSPLEKFDKLSLVFAPGGPNDSRKGINIFPQILTILDGILKEKDLKIDVYWAGLSFFELPEYSNINNIFKDQLNEEQMRALFRGCHVHALPTLADNLPNTIIEALACGTPTVCFNVGGCGDAVKPGVTGFLVSPGNLDFFGHDLAKLLIDVDYSKIAVDCRQFFEENFSMEKQVKSYVGLIKNILSEKNN